MKKSHMHFFKGKYLVKRYLEMERLLYFIIEYKVLLEKAPKAKYQQSVCTDIEYCQMELKVHWIHV